jgi:hypothetical protein
MKSAMFIAGAALIAGTALFAVVSTCCSGAPLRSEDAVAVQAVSAATLPPQGVYNSCEIDTALTTMCEQEDAAMASDGYTWEINYIGLMAHKTGAESLQAWFIYDAAHGIGQAINVKSALVDPSGDPLNGKILTNYNADTNLATDCGATTNEQLIQCVLSVARSVPGFNWKWYIYDEPGCPNQSIGYCQGTIAGRNYRNVQTLASYIASIDPSHQIIGVQVGDAGGQTVIDNLFSWLSTASTSAIGFDRYPVPSGGRFGSIDDIGTIAGELAKTVAANPSENIYFVGQAFSWSQEGGAGCASVTVCPYPTTAQMQDMRDQALYYAEKAGRPISMVLWYYWPDITCLNTYAGCNALANRSSLRSAAFAAFPATPPP